MRKMHLIHGDIKPENIRFSRLQKRVVFIDFGLSKFINEKINEESMTYVRGTYNWIGKDLLKLK